MWIKFKRAVYNQFIPLIKVWNYYNWRLYLARTTDIRLVVGAGGTYFKGWFSTDKSVLDITKRSDFEKYFKEKKISRILAEHVLEHLTDSDLKSMAKNFAEFSSDDINIRIAVPDGNHKNQNYIDAVKPGGHGSGADDHKHLFTYESLAKYFTDAGFVANYLEYWDNNNNFITKYKKDENGFIERSLINDSRNADGNPNYTSIIIDFKKRH